MYENGYVPLTTGRRHSSGKITYIVNSFAVTEGSRTAADLIMDMLISIVKKKEGSI